MTDEGEDIVISFTYPPIPIRNFDWTATRKGWEPGEPYGQGRTPIVALADLLERELEADEQSDVVSLDSDYCSCGAIHDGLEEFQRCKACGKII